jgi:hypothetical protein
MEEHAAQPGLGAATSHNHIVREDEEMQLLERAKGWLVAVHPSMSRAQVQPRRRSMQAWCSSGEGCHDHVHPHWSGMIRCFARPERSVALVGVAPCGA